MRLFLIAICVMVCGCAPRCSVFGKVAIGTGDKYYSTVGWLPDTDLVLCEDGSMRWKNSDRTK